MATAGDIITRSLRLLGQVGAGEDPDDDELADGLTALNALLDSWRNERLMCYATQTESLTLSSATASYTIGPGGTLSTTRPVDIEDAWIVASSVSYPVRMVSDEEYDAIPDKTGESDWPTKANYRGTMSTGTLYVWPVPNATRTMNLRTRVILTSFSTTGDTVTLPPGWQRALAANLAIDIAPEYETSPRPEVVMMARESKAAIKVTNSAPHEVVTDLALLFPGRSASILTDQ